MDMHLRSLSQTELFLLLQNCDILSIGVLDKRPSIPTGRMVFQSITPNVQLLHYSILYLSKVSHGPRATNPRPQPSLGSQSHTLWHRHRCIFRTTGRFIIAQPLALASADIVDRQDARGIWIVVLVKGNTAASQTVMLNHLLHLQPDRGAGESEVRYVSLHEGAVKPPGGKRVRVDMVHHAGYVLPGVVTVSIWNGVHVVAQGMHDLRSVGTDAHDSTALAVQAHVHFLSQESPVVRVHDVETICGIGFGLQQVPIRRWEIRCYRYTVICGPGGVGGLYVLCT